VFAGTWKTIVPEAQPAAFDLATSLNNLSLQLSGSGDRAGALRAIEEAVEIYRRLSQGQPAAFEPALATSLNSLSLRLSDSGDRAAALRAIEEAVEIYRRLSQGQPAAFEPALATSLYNLSLRLSDSGDRAAALRAIEEAGEVRRRLAQGQPTAFEPDLARSLYNLSLRLSGSGDRAGALRTIEEAVEIYRRLAQGQPAAFEPALAGSLDSLSAQLSESGERAGALEEAVEIYRWLAQGQPGALEPDLPVSPDSLSAQLSESGDRAGALRAIEEAVEIYRRLAQGQPAAFEPELAQSPLRAIEEAGEIRRQLAAGQIRRRLAEGGIRRRLARGQPAAFESDRTVSLEEVVEGYRRLAQEQPAAFEPALVGYLINFSAELSESGDRAAALGALEEAVEIYRRLAQRQPAAFEPDLAGYLIDLSAELSGSGDRAAAMRAIEEAVVVYRRLTQGQPDAFEPDLAMGLYSLFFCLSESGDRAGALRAIEEAVEIYRRLAERQPAAFEPALAMSLKNLSLQLSAKDTKQALSAAHTLVTAETARINGHAHSGDGDPFGFLGMHRTPEGGLVVQAIRPNADSLELIDSRTGEVAGVFQRTHPEAVFRLELPKREPFAYRLRENNGVAALEFEDPYRFGKVLSDLDTRLIRQGNHLRLWEVLGAHLRELEGVRGTTFAVWAPNARRVSVVGDFNDWDGRVHAMRFRGECGVWEIFIPVELAGNYYKYELVGPDDNLLPLRADPVGFAHELRPATASIVVPPGTHVWSDAQWMERRGEISQRDRPIAIYEVHLGSWRRKGAHGDQMLTYRELADTLLPYVRDLGFTHIELLPITEHPFDGSWGYQTTGMYAPTSRHGSPDDFRAFIDRAHAEGIGVIFDWVPGHFAADTHGLVYFDGTQLYEHEDMRKGFHVEWGTFSHNLGRNEVSNFLIASALFWFEQFHIDGLRVDAVSSIIYLDYGRRYDEWMPNTCGGNENLEGSAFLRRLNTTVYREFPTAMTVAEESTAFPMVSRPADSGGLGFGYKWNMGWMHDTLHFFSVDPLSRGYHLNELSFGISYAWTENFILPFSHDEVVHLKRSLLGRMPGDDEPRFASLRALYAFMYMHPGKKLLFMGAEFAQESEWSESRSLDWGDQLPDDPRRQGVHALIRDLNRFYRESPALYTGDAEPAGFEWIDCTDATNVVISFLRRDPQSGAFLVVVLNASGLAHQDYRVGVPQGGAYRERLNTDAEVYGGRNCGNLGEVTATEPGAHGRPYALSLTLPPQSVLVLEPA
jgi:1,4-alpha-glucan branching enzyme